MFLTVLLLYLLDFLGEFLLFSLGTLAPDHVVRMFVESYSDVDGRLVLGETVGELVEVLDFEGIATAAIVAATDISSKFVLLIGLTFFSFSLIR